MSIYRTHPEVASSDLYATPVNRREAGSATAASKDAQVPPPSVLAPASVLAQRKPQDVQGSDVLLEHALLWADTLPERVKPRRLMRVYPRVANMLALLWTERTRSPFDEYMESLLVDQRGDRQGFPPDVMTDLLTLREAFDQRRRSG